MDLTGIDCQLRLDLTNILWWTCLGVSLLVVFASASMLIRWLRGGEIDWVRLRGNRCFKLLVGVIWSSTLYALYAVLRQLGFIAFNDYLGSVVYYCAQTASLLQAINLSELCHDTFVALLRATGCAQFIRERARWTPYLSLLLAIVPFLPILLGPALDPQQRIILVQYHLVVFTLVPVEYICIIVYEGERTLRLLAQLGTETTKSPMKKIRLLTLVFYTTGGFVIVCNLVLVCTDLITRFPLYLAIFCTIVPPLSFLCIAGLAYDPSAVKKPARPKTTIRSSEENRSKSKSKSAEVQATTPDVSQRGPPVPGDEPREKASPEHLELA